MSFRGWLLTSLFRWSANRRTDEMTLQAARDLEYREMPKSFVYKSTATQVESTLIQHVPVEWYNPPRADKQRVIMYIHGGAYCAKTPLVHRPMTIHMAELSETRIIAPDYRLAPEHPYPAGLDDVRLVYKHLLATGYAPENIFLMGDSAGGGMCLALMLCLRDEGLPLPAAAFLISPWVDLYAEETPRLLELAKKDAYIRLRGLHTTAKWYAQELPLTHPHISPAFANLKDLPPLLIHMSKDEVLLEGNERLVKQAQQDGVSVTFKTWDGLFHVFQIMSGIIPEARQSLQEAAWWIQKQPSRAKV
jgi:epsilon-lactone hydrolase